MRKIIFWLHLFSALISGVVIAIMSITGIVIAFEHEILSFLNSSVTRINIPENQSRLTPETMLQKAKSVYPEFAATYIEISSDPVLAVRLQNQKRESLFINPYTAEIHKPQSTQAHDFLHAFEEWHRYLGMAGKHRKWGKLITGSCNLIFLFLCISGLYLWFPKKWIWKLFKKNLLLNPLARKTARDLNWHNVFGFWNLPLLTILAGTAVIFSFGWAHDLIFRVFGDEAPKHRDFRMMMVEPPIIDSFSADTDKLNYIEVVDRIDAAFPDWQSIGIRLHDPQPANTTNPGVQPLILNVYRPALFSTMGLIPVHMHPHTGEILQQTEWSQRSPGLRARVWARFLHTGEAFGVVGKIIATLSTAASLILVYTGFTLTYHRFRKMVSASSRRRAR